jgi:uncharacterized protein (DUF1697 family)
MTRHIVLLRGINIGPRNRVAMPKLREALTDAGFGDVRTYVQSGNVVLSSDRSADEVAAECERAISDTFGLDIDVVVRSRGEMAAVVKRNPLKKVADNPKRYQVSFLDLELDPGVVAELAESAAPTEAFAAVGRELYAWHPEGVARSKLSARLADRRLGVKATARNWRTVTTLLEMADE